LPAGKLMCDERDEGISNGSQPLIAQRAGAHVPGFFNR